MLTETMQQLITRHTLGFVASVNADGSPNLSPKGTFVVLNDKQIMFAEIRSPNTVRNIQHNPQIEVNFVDPFARKGVRVKGAAMIVEKTDQNYQNLYPYFNVWGELANSIRRIILIEISQAKIMTSPIYDIGAQENEMIQTWQDKYKNMYD